MYEYIKGCVSELNPTQVIVEAGGVGYHILISLQTYSLLQVQKAPTQVWLHYHVREDAALLFGFAQKEEREMFRLLIATSGIGPNSARMILSSLSTEELRQALLTEDLPRLKGIKGIGLKTAQRLIVELKDKVVKLAVGSAWDGNRPVVGAPSALREEAASALQMLGFPKAAVEKTLDQILRVNPQYSLEELIKTALKQI